MNKLHFYSKIGSKKSITQICLPKNIILQRMYYNIIIKSNIRIYIFILMIF